MHDNGQPLVSTTIGSIRMMSIIGQKFIGVGAREEWESVRANSIGDVLYRLWIQEISIVDSIGRLSVCAPFGIRKI